MLQKIALITTSGVLLATLSNPAHASRKQAKLDAKLSAYVKAINVASPQLRENRKLLTAFENEGKATTGCKENHVSWPISSNGYSKSIYEELAKAAKRRPRTKIDKAAKRMAKALEALDAAHYAGREYYQKREYKTDDCGRSSELNQQYADALGVYIETALEIRTFVEERNAKRAAKLLEKTKRKYGEGFRYYHQKIMINGKAFLDAVDAQSKLDIEALEPEVDAFAENIGQLTTMVEKNKTKLDQFAYYRFFRRASELNDAIAAFIERQGPDGKAYSDYEKTQLERGRTNVTGSYAKVVYKYNQVVEVSNRIRYPKSIK